VTRYDRLSSLTGLRALAALGVFSLHFLMPQFARDMLAEDFPEIADRALIIVAHIAMSCVSYFFILSGFVLTWVARADGSVAFWRRRFARVYPVYVITTGLALVIWASVGPVDPMVLVVQVLLLQSWVTNQNYYFGLNGVTWTLSCEAFFYLCFPALNVLLTRVSCRVLRVVALCSTAITLFLPGLVNGVFTIVHPEPDGGWISTERYGGPFIFWFTYVFPLTRLAEFVLGAVLALLVVRRRWIGPGVLFSLLLVAIGWWIGQQLGGYVQIAASTVIPLAFLVTALALADRTGAWSPFRSRTLVWLGEMSYSFYAIHAIVVVCVGPLLAAGISNWDLVANANHALPGSRMLLVGVATLGACMLVARALYRLVELPGVRLLIRGRRAEQGRSGLPVYRDIR
jgi:peptidoglycan/LPS O-acetylase OafA/YrhL